MERAVKPTLRNGERKYQSLKSEKIVDYLNASYIKSNYRKCGIA
jgi:protein tyrosine phosphatase